MILDFNTSISNELKREKISNGDQSSSLLIVHLGRQKNDHNKTWVSVTLVGDPH